MALWRGLVASDPRSSGSLHSGPHQCGRDVTIFSSNQSNPVCVLLLFLTQSDEIDLFLYSFSNQPPQFLLVVQKVCQ